MKLFRSGARAQRPGDTGQHIQISNPWHAVAVRSASVACPVCKALAGRRFLSREAPKIPVAGCLHPALCRSVYQHFDDRREAPRRAADQVYAAANTPRPADKERRQLRGRRSTDGYRW